MARGIDEDYQCNSCIYRCLASVGYGNATCDYMLITGKRRGCPGGNNCTKYEEGIKKKRVSRLQFAKIR